MLIRVLTGCVVDGLRVAAGEVVDASDKAGAYLISSGAAEQAQGIALTNAPEAEEAPGAAPPKAKSKRSKKG